MTLPPSFPMSMSDVATELGLSLPLSLNHAWVISLAGKSSLPVSFSDLLGKNGNFYGAVLTGASSGSPSSWSGNITQSFFGGGFLGLIGEYNAGYLDSVQFQSPPNWSGNLMLKNITTGAQSICTKNGNSVWNASSPSANLIRPSQNDTFSIYPSN